MPLHRPDAVRSALEAAIVFESIRLPCQTASERVALLVIAIKITIVNRSINNSNLEAVIPFVNIIQDKQFEIGQARKRVESCSAVPPIPNHSSQL